MEAGKLDSNTCPCLLVCVVLRRFTPCMLHVAPFQVLRLLLQCKVDYENY